MLGQADAQVPLFFFSFSWLRRSSNATSDPWKVLYKYKYKYCKLIPEPGEGFYRVAGYSVLVQRVPARNGLCISRMS